MPAPSISEGVVTKYVGHSLVPPASSGPELRRTLYPAGSPPRLKLTGTDGPILANSVEGLFFWSAWKILRFTGEFSF